MMIRFASILAPYTDYIPMVVLVSFARLAPINLLLAVLYVVSAPQSRIMTIFLDNRFSISHLFLSIL